MRTLYDPGKAVETITSPISKIFKPPKVDVPNLPSPREAVDAEDKAKRDAAEEASRKAKAAALTGGRRSTLLTSSAGPAGTQAGIQTQRRTLLGSV